MRTLIIRIALIAFVFISILDDSNCMERTLEFSFNENCGKICENTDVRFGHVKATGPNDTIHYLWDFTHNPSLLIAVTLPSAKLQISWKDFKSRKPKALKFTEKPIYTFGMAIERLFEFNDVDDTGRIDQVKNQTNVYELKLKNFMWHHKNMTKQKDYVEFYVEANTFRDPAFNYTRDGSLQFTTHTFGKQDHSPVMPRLYHSENNTQMDIIFNNLKTKHDFSNSRYAFEVVLASDNKANSTFSINTTRKIDDEFTPGIFEVMELVTPYVPDKSAFLQWRPISYVADDRDITNSTGITFYPFKKATIDDYFDKDNLLYMYYGEGLFNTLLQRFNVSFGSIGDGFYNEKHYNSWTFVAGYGEPLQERFSRLATVVIIIGVSIPAIYLLLSIFYVCWKRNRQNNHGERLE